MTLLFRIGFAKKSNLTKGELKGIKLLVWRALASGRNLTKGELKEVNFRQHVEHQPSLAESHEGRIESNLLNR